LAAELVCQPGYPDRYDKKGSEVNTADFLRIIEEHRRGYTTLDETAGRLIYAVESTEQADELIRIAPSNVREALTRFVQKAPHTDAEWAAKPFPVLDGDCATVEEYRTRVRAAVEALRDRLSV
jgi:hypothetical protein